MRFSRIDTARGSMGIGVVAAAAADDRGSRIDTDLGSQVGLDGVDYCLCVYKVHSETKRAHQEKRKLLKEKVHYCSKRKFVVHAVIWCAMAKKSFILRRYCSRRLSSCQRCCCCRLALRPLRTRPSRTNRSIRRRRRPSCRVLLQLSRRRRSSMTTSLSFL
jgi:hypothetical protein